MLFIEKFKTFIIRQFHVNTLFFQILSGLRNGLDFTPLHETTENHGNSETLTVTALRDAVLGARDVATAWLNIIENVPDASSHKPLDVIILLVIYSSIPVFKKRVETIFRYKMKMELFKTSLLEKLFKSFHVVCIKIIKDFTLNLRYSYI